MGEAVQNPAGLSDNDRFLRTAFNRQLLPAILSVGGVMVSTMANSIIAGNLLGHEALAVMSIASPIYFIFATIGSLAGVGGTALAAWCIGRNDSRGSHRAFTLSAVLALGTSLLLTLLGLLLLDPFITALGAEGELHTLAKPYVTLFLLGGIGVAGIYPPYFFLKLEGRLRLSVVLFVCLALLNVGLDFFFVLAADMGYAGIAAGTAVANVAAAVVGWACLLRGGSFRLCSLRGYWREAGRLVTAGSPAALNNLCNVVRSIALNRIIFSLAMETGLSSFNIVTTASNLALMVINGLAQTTIPFIGVFSSERDTASIRQLEKRAILEGAAMILPVSILLAVFSRPFCTLFGVTAPEVLAQSAPAVAIFAISLLPAMISTILVNYYQSSGLTGLANLFTACRALFLVVLSALLLAPVLRVKAVWLAFTLTELLSWVVLAAALAVYRRRHPERRGLLLLESRYEKEGRYISFSVHSSLEDIMEASRCISEFCETNQLDAQRSMLISLSLEEMLISIKEHCFPQEDDRDVSIRILISEGERTGDSAVVLRIRCSGTPFNPIAYYEARQAERTAAPDGPAPSDGDGMDGLDALDGLELLDDSLGIAMIVSSAKLVDYKSTFGVNNLTILL